MTGVDLKLMREAKGFTQQAFADKVGITRELLNKMESGRQKVSKATKILVTNFLESEISIREGLKKEEKFGMVEEENVPYHTQRFMKKLEPKPNKELKIFGNTDAAAGDVDVDMTPITQPTEIRTVSEVDLFYDCDAVLKVYGNSMNPNYPAGTDLGLEENLDSFFEPGELYVIETRSRRVFKRIYPSKRGSDWITCYSDNTMKHETGPMLGEFFYPPFEIPVSEVTKKFDVVGHQRRNKNSKILYRR